VQNLYKMETKAQLVAAVREWVRIDGEISALQKEMSSRRKEKKQMSEQLMTVMKSMAIDVFDLKDGQLMYKKTKAKKPISKVSLISSLSNYFDGNAEKAAEVGMFIMENREEVVKETIVKK
jgi:hypothetical protein